MDEEILEKERQKLQEILKKMDVQEQEIENYIAERSTNLNLKIWLRQMLWHHRLKN